MPDFIPKDEVPNLTEREYGIIRTLLGKECAILQLDCNSEDVGLRNLSKILYPGHVSLLDKFVSRKDKW